MSGDDDENGSPQSKRRRTTTSSTASLIKPPHGDRNASSLDSGATTSLPNQAKWFRNPSVVWFRGHDLRVEDHPALLAAAQRGGPVVPLFIWDNEDAFGRGLGQMKQWWLERSLRELATDLTKLGVQLHVRVGRCPVQLREFIKATGADAVFWNRCYEPDLLQRDEEMRAELGQEGLTAESFKAELLVEPWELANSETCPPFKTFHEYMRAWMSFPPPPHPFPCPSKLKSLTPSNVEHGKIHEMGLTYSKELDERLSKMWTPGSDQAKVQLKNFLQNIFPVFGEAKVRRHRKGTSKLSPHIRFGELSPRRMYHATRLRVSRWHPDGDTSSPLAATFGLPSVQSKDVSATARTPQEPRSSDKKGRISNQRENTSDNSACSSQHPNFGVRHSQIANEAPKLVSQSIEVTKLPVPSPSRSPTPSASNTPDYSSDGQQEIPHISLSAKAFLKNLCLRDFSYHILFHHPNFNVKPLVPEFVDFPWSKDSGAFDAWRFGKTGYPIVDAAMRELRTTGWIHNAMRFLLACFLTKYLLLPWTYGLKEFYDLLLDGDHSANALGWQWTSGSNTDSFPFSCLLNPSKLARRLDPDGEYVRHWVPELVKLPNEFIHQPWLAPENVCTSVGFKYGYTYPCRIVDPGQARKRAKEAMHYMKRIFAAKRPCIPITEKPLEDFIKEWPQDEPEDETANMYGGRAGLYPSLWSLFDEPALLTSRDSGQSGHLSSLPNSDPGSGSVDDDSIERVLLNAYSTMEKEDLLIESMDVIGSSRESGGLQSRRPTSREKRQESRNGSGSQDAVMPTSTPAQQQHQILPNSMKPQKEVEAEAASILAQAGARLAPLGGVPAFSGVGARPHHPMLMPMQVNQMHQPTNPVVFDPMYASGMAPTPTAPLPITNFPMMMGHGHTNIEAGVANGVNPSDVNSRAIYAHQMMYGLPFQMMHTQRPAVVERDQLYQSAASNPSNGTPAPNTRHMSVAASTNFGVHYGMYGNHSFDHGAFVNPAAASMEVNHYGAPVHIAPQQAAPQVAPRGQQHPQTHSIYLTQPHQPEGVIGEARQPTPNIPPTIAPNGRINSARQISPLPTLRDQQQDAKVPVAVESPKTKQNAKDKRTVPGSKGVAVDADGAPSRRPRSTSKRGTSSTRSVAAGGITKQLSSGGSRRTSNKSATAASPGSNRSRTSRSRRGSSSRGGRSRSDSRSSSRVGDGSAPTSNSRNRRTHGDDEGGPGGTTLKERQKILEGVGSQEDHEYYHFAQFLIRTYELTKNTDRHTSKDYIRLCTLKDNYHKQCPTDKDKLKIYTIKSFFSKILRLEVTGEYDRHSHGGVRGPYVYGIKLSAGPANSTGATERR